MTFMGLLSPAWLRSAWADLLCNRCGQAISGRYMQYKSNTKTVTVCQKCNQDLPRCPACQIPTRREALKFKSGDWLCPDCFQNALYCSLCKGRVQGQYFKDSTGNTIYCSSCYSRYAKCKVCGRPTPPNLLDPASGACAECMKKIPACGCCGKGITGTYYNYTGLEGAFCEECHLHRDKCYTCGIPLKDSYWKFPDGRKICDRCNARAVIDEKTIRAIMAEVEQLIPKYLGMKVTNPYTLYVETLNKQSIIQANMAKVGELKESPLYGNELGLYRYKNGQSEIFLLYGLPPELIYETAAHEYAHAWQTENAVPDQSLEVREGFAQWVAAEILKVKGYKNTLEKLEKRTDHPYGTGYRRFKTVFENTGRENVLEYAKKTRK
jgi:hypothetical protein